MEKTEKKDGIPITISRRDKIYISVIVFLVAAIIVLAIVLPRPYKFIEIESVRYETVYKKVYETEKVYIINPASSLASSGTYTDGEGNLYKGSFSKTYLDTGNLKDIKVTVIYSNQTSASGNKLTRSLSSIKTLKEAIVYDSPTFGKTIEFTNAIITSVNTLLEENIKSEEFTLNNEYLFEISFEKCDVNFLVSYIGA